MMLLGKGGGMGEECFAVVEFFICSRRMYISFGIYFSLVYFLFINLPPDPGPLDQF